ncbi:MAG TPA: acetoin utilization protein AcuC [Chloroflexota bacterium]|nr:acetoin utilization protein AcuC [Chloroflexota bacterium]
MGASDAPPEHAARLLACPDYARYDFGPRHPLNPRRYDASLDLLRRAGLLHDSDTVCPPPATVAELELVHTAQYVEALARLSDWAPLTEAPLEAEARRYGLGVGDNPVFPGAHEAAALVVGGSVHVARTLCTPGASGEVRHFFHPMGGLHHGMPARASGFCLYNDPAVAIAAVVQERQARVLYIDLDVHHGDGVQQTFEDDPRVMTVSFHESGAHLFPGTGDVLELGRGAGRGTAVNVPLAPGTDDESYVAALEAVLPPLAEGFRPDVIMSQHGCDTHVWDPLADLQLTTRALEHAARLVHRLAHELCDGRWLAWGGGGYDLYRVVPRHWALLWAEMAGRAVPMRLPDDWRLRWEAEAGVSLPETFRDSADGVASVAAARAAEANRNTVQRVRRLLLPASQRLSKP